MKNRKFKIWLVLGLALMITVPVAFKSAPTEKYFEIAKNLDIFATLFKEVNSYYVDEISPNKLIKEGIDAMLQSLDPYTNFIPEDDIEDYRTMTTGQYGGIGAMVGKRNGRSMVIMPFKDFPAHKAGLLIGDEILAIDGVPINEKNTESISKLLKGQANSKITLKVKRFGIEEPMDIELTREKININNVPYYGMVNEEIGYIKLSDFTTDAGKEVKKALIELKEKGAKKVIFDVRDNPGGLLNEAVNVSNVFVPKGSEIVSTKGKVTDWNKSYKALDDALDTEIPVVVLTSQRSASAAEIVAGVIQDYDRGVLVGRKTFGKGLVQATRPLTYNSQLKITTAKYHIPSGRCIQAIDYSNRNEDGSVGSVPDSLQQAFKTVAGRTVFDGGGVKPDIEVENLNLAPITVSLLSKNLLFDYATRYYHTKEKVESVRDFKITDAIYEDFVAWLANKDYDYTTQVEKNIDQLIENAKEEKYYSNIEKQIYSLKDQVMHNKEQDLRTFKREISNLLKDEIVSRYFLQEGIYENSFSYDPDIIKAVEVLNNSKRYDEILVRID